MYERVLYFVLPYLPNPLSTVDIDGQSAEASQLVGGDLLVE